MIYFSSNELNLSQETDDKLFNRQEERLTQMRYDLNKKSNMLLLLQFQKK